MFADVNQLFSYSTPAQSSQPSFPGPTMAGVFGDPGNASFVPAEQPDGIDKLKQMQMQQNVPAQAMSADPAQARSQFVQSLQDKYGPDFIQHPEVIKMLEEIQKQMPIQNNDQSSLQMQGKRTLSALQKVGTT